MTSAAGVSLGQMITPDGRTVNAAQLASTIKADPNWHGQPVEIRGCAVGQSVVGPSMAQQLANQLMAPVTAPTQIASWDYFQIGGMYFSLGMSGGQTMTFTPKP